MVVCVLMLRLWIGFNIRVSESCRSATVPPLALTLTLALTLLSLLTLMLEPGPYLSLILTLSLTIILLSWDCYIQAQHSHFLA